MITVPEATEKIIKRSRYLTEALQKDLINASSLARYIKPEVESMVFKEVTQSSILMAIQRLARDYKKHAPTTQLFSEAPDMVVRSNLALFYVQISSTLLSCLKDVETESHEVQKRVLFTYGRSECLILANKLTVGKLRGVLQNEKFLKEFEHVSAITIHVPSTSVTTPGILNMFIKSLSWEGINIIGVLTTESEITLVFLQPDTNAAFSILQGIFTLE